MMNLYTKSFSLGRRLGLTAALLGGTALAAQAQLVYSVNTATNTAGTYTDLAATGTVIATTSTDDANSTAQEIGFSFGFNGQTFTQFVLNTNGLIRLGSAAPSAANMFIQNETAATNPTGVDPITSTDPADVNLLAPFNFDLEQGASAAEYRVSTIGTAPNRICVVQWKNVRDKAATNPVQHANFAFQLRLYETTNAVEFVYAAPTPGTGTAIGRYATIGIKGSGSVAGQTLLVTKNSSQTAWSGATFISGNGTRVFFRRTFAPDDGRTFRFNPAPANDAAVVFYTLGKVLNPAGRPAGVRAVVTNQGSGALTNLPVTFTMTGANNVTATQTVASLAVGASTTLTFPYPATLNLGNSTLAVSVPNDGDNTNNSATQTQQISTTTLSYTPPDLTNTVNSAVGFGVNSGILASKYTLTTAAPITATSIFLDGGAVGRTVYGVVLSATGTILARTDNYVITTAEANAYKRFTFATPPTVPAGDFYVGLAQVASTTATYPLGTQAETPTTRTGAYYTFALTGGTASDAAGSNLGRFLIDAVSILPPSCDAPQALSYSNVTAGSVAVSFLPVSGAASYQLQYGPTGFDPTAGGTIITIPGSPYTLTGLTPGVTYQIYLRTNCGGTTGGTSDLAGTLTVAIPCGTAAFQAFPYSENFDALPAGQTLPCGVTVLNANGDAATWGINRTNPYSGTNAMRYNGNAANNVAANDWFFTPALSTVAGTRYQVAFRYRAEGIAPSPSNFTEALEVKAGPAATVAGQTTTLYSNTAITNTTYALANGTSAPVVAFFTPGAGTQYVGFHAISAAGQSNIYVDDVSITAMVVTASTSETLLRAVTVFPNPSTTGLFDLDIHTAQAKGAFAVQVTNALGQQVYTGTARDNATNRLDLSSLAAGIYHLQVRQGDDFVTRTLSIVK